MRVDNKKGVWYEVTIYDCVLCGRVRKYKERKESPKPQDPLKVVHIHQDACAEHFF